MCTYSKHTAGKNPKESQKWSNLTPGHLSLPEEMIERAVINYFSACDLQGSILPFPQAYVTPVFLFLIYCLPPDSCFILFQKYQFLTLVPLRLGLRVVSCGRPSDVSPSLHKQQMGRTGSVSILSSITKIMWRCDTQGTTKGETDLIPFPYKSPPLFRLCKPGKKTDAEAIWCGVCEELGMGILCVGCTLEPDPH